MEFIKYSSSLLVYIAELIAFTCGIYFIMLHRDNSTQFIGKVVRFDCEIILCSAEMIPKPTIKVCILYYKHNALKVSC